MITVTKPADQIADIEGLTAALAQQSTAIAAEASARATADTSHAGLTTLAHGGLVASNDSRLTNSRTPTAHANTHGYGQADALTISEGQIPGLITDLAAKAPLASPSFTGNVGINGAANYRLDVHGTAATDAIGTDIGMDIHQVVAPASAPTVALQTAAGNIDAGQHRYTVTYITALGETALNTSALTAKITADASHGQVNLTNIPVSPDPRVTGRRILRTIASSSDYDFRSVAVINDNTTTTFTDNVADGSLGVLGSGAYPNYYYARNTTCKFITVNGTIAMMLDQYDTTFGLRAGQAITTGYNNALFGYGAGGSITTGSNNVLVGASTGASVTSGTGNVLVGCVSGGVLSSGTANTVVGTYAGYSTPAAGGLNVLIGYGVGWNNASTGTNTFLGAYSGYTGTANAGGVYIGYQAGYYETGSNKLFIDNTSRTNEADARIKALIYGIFDAAIANQSLTVNGKLKTSVGLNIPTGTPATANAAGTTGDIQWDQSYVYICVANSTWKRAAISTW